METSYDTNISFQSTFPEDVWSLRERHIAVVNPVGRDSADPSVRSLKGEWEFVALNSWPRRRASFNHPFALAEDWGETRKINVPGCWEAQGVGAEGEWGKSWECSWDAGWKHIRNKHLGEGWYRREVDIPADWTNKRIWIAFGGVNAQGWVWVNNVEVAKLDSWCGTYRYEITDLVKPGERAKIVVEVDNRAPSKKGCFNYVHRWGGLYRDVELQATPQTFLEDVWVQGDVETMRPVVNAVVCGETEGISVVADFGGVETFEPWSPLSPCLYWADVSLLKDGKVIECRRERFAFRKLEVSGCDFLLNGKTVFLRGFGDDAVYPLTGISPADRAFHKTHLQKAKRAGFNFVRLHTHCEVPEYFEAADEVGILVQAELPYYSDIPTCDFDFNPLREARELHEHFRRYASYAVTSACNEGSFGTPLARHFYQVVKGWDPARLVIEGDSNNPDYNQPGVSDYASGPISMWPRGSYNPGRPFVCHEYLNLCVKLPAALEEKFTGAWLPPETNARRDAWLATFGLGRQWGERLQFAQHKLQAIWQRRGVVAARTDPHCRGYCFWTIVDVCVKTEEGDDKPYSAQGLFDPFWNDKPGGLTAEEFAAFNGEEAPSADLAEFRFNDVAPARVDAEKMGVDIVIDDLKHAAELFNAGHSILFVGGLSKDGESLPLNVALGWWAMGEQVGTAIKEHAVWGDFAHEAYMDERFFRILKKGAELPLANFAESELVMVGEGGKKCFCNLAVKEKGKARMVFAWGLDILSDLSESVSLYNNFVKWAAQPAE